MGWRRELGRNLSRLSRPDAAELGRRNRQSGLNQALKIYAEDPQAGSLAAPVAWVSFADGVPKVKAYKDGVLYEAAMTEVGG